MKPQYIKKLKTYFIHVAITAEKQNLQQMTENIFIFVIITS